MWIFILIVLAVVVYFLVSQASSSNQASKTASRTQASKASSQNYINQVDYSNLEVSLESVSIHYNYTRLRDLLAEGKWREADEETSQMMLSVGNSIAYKKLSNEEYQRLMGDNWFGQPTTEYLPCEDLCTIDRLWLKYSNGRFGFSVQKRIMSELGGEDKLRLMRNIVMGGRNQTNQELLEFCEFTERFVKRIGWYDPNSREGRVDLKKYKDLTFAIQAPYGHLPTTNYFDEAHLRETKRVSDHVFLFVLNRFSGYGIAL